MTMPHAKVVGEVVLDEGGTVLKQSVAVLDGHAATLVAYLLLELQRTYRVDTLDELLKRMMFSPENVRAVREAQEAMVLAAQLSPPAQPASPDFPAEPPPVSASGESDGWRVTSLPVSAAAELLGVSPRRVRQLAVAGTISGERGLSGWRLDRVSVEEYAEARGLAA